MSQSSLRARPAVRTGLSWVAVAAVLAVLPEAGAAGSRPGSPEAGTEPSPRFALANPAIAAGLSARLITRSIKPLDLDRLTEAHFGDIEAQDSR